MAPPPGWQGCAPRFRSFGKGRENEIPKQGFSSPPTPVLTQYSASSLVKEMTFDLKVGGVKSDPSHARPPLPPPQAGLLSPHLASWRPDEQRHNTKSAEEMKTINTQCRPQGESPIKGLFPASSNFHPSVFHHPCLPSPSFLFFFCLSLLFCSSHFEDMIKL